MGFQFNAAKDLIYIRFNIGVIIISFFLAPLFGNMAWTAITDYQGLDTVFICQFGCFCFCRRSFLLTAAIRKNE